MALEFRSDYFYGVIARADSDFVHPKSCLLNSSSIFSLIHLKICRVSSHGTKLCMCFSSFDSTFLWTVHAHIYFAHPKSCLRNSSYIFHQVHLIFRRLSSCDTKMCMWIWKFNFNIFDRVTAHADLGIVPITPSMSMIGLT